ncbi:MEDS domain-containing protein [Pseudonocardia charpentierae]|uniref:MEDS domain-containing protein n=1 Tax=Pseudonocardia charpentierae TaxID=3075545 RepID=A0ABU2NJ67_9PSEU|nr:MEDS domain-containing protein [Pseudonocardia sp. DSM 45834]MDT0354020.1 MEDS domain-containing protein [Pseudonocardia sp. DSM 45834]
MTELWVEPPSTGRSRTNHVCWPFRHHDELVAVARGYVAEGLARHERVVGYLPEEHLPNMEEQLAGLEGLDECVERGQLQLHPTGALAGMDQPVDSGQGLSTLTAMIGESLDAGFTGLRMFGDMTVRMADPARRAEFVHYEHEADRFCLDHAYTALCAYDRRVLGDAAVAEVACVHPMAHGGLSPFQLSATGRADVALAGSVDAFSSVGLLTALQRIGVPAFGVEASIDAAALEFIDHRALVTLDQHVARHRSSLVLQSAPSIVARLIELIPLRAVRLEDTP